MHWSTPGVVNGQDSAAMVRLHPVVGDGGMLTAFVSVSLQFSDSTPYNDTLPTVHRLSVQHLSKAAITENWVRKFWVSQFWFFSLHCLLTHYPYEWWAYTKYITQQYVKQVITNSTSCNLQHTCECIVNIQIMFWNTLLCMMCIFITQVPLPHKIDYLQLKLHQPKIIICQCIR